MPANTLEEKILFVVKEAKGIKDHEVPFVLRKHMNIDLPEAEVSKAIEQLVQNKQLIAIEYSFDFTFVRNFLLPAKTPFIVRGQREETKRI